MFYGKTTWMTTNGVNPSLQLPASDYVSNTACFKLTVAFWVCGILYIGNDRLESLPNKVLLQGYHYSSTKKASATVEESLFFFPQGIIGKNGW